MQVRRYVWVLWLFMGSLLAACAGGSGSSGFDDFPNAENAAINQALSQQSCVDFHGLSICPADTAPLTVSPTPTSVPSTTPTNVTVTPPGPSPTALQMRTASPTGVPSTRTPTPTPGIHPPHKPHVDTGVDTLVPIPCELVVTDNSCVFVVPFVSEGFEPGTTFRVAVRTSDPPSAWSIGARLTSNGAPDVSVFDAPVAVAAPARKPTSPARVQLAVLAFGDPQANPPDEVATLAESGADFAFVTAAVTLQPAPERGTITRE